jgi:hypothetical protein
VPVEAHETPFETRETRYETSRDEIRGEKRRAKIERPG